MPRRHESTLQKRVRWSTTVTAFVLLARPASGQGTPPPQAGPSAAEDGPSTRSSTVTPPRLKADAPATYPAQALAEHVSDPVTVILVLEIDPTGAVRKVTVESPRGHGFDEAASSAASKLVFDPATRGGAPVAARIKFQYAFAPPAARLVGRISDRDTDRPIAGAQVVVTGEGGLERTIALNADGTWALADMPPGAVHVTVSATGYDPLAIDETVARGEETSLVLRLARSAPVASPSAGGGQNSEEEVEEVVVRGDRPPREVTKRTLTKDEVAHIPGTNGDALRSIQSLPGVARPPPFSGALIVRGSAPADTTIFVDGVDIPLVYHFGGLSSVVPTELLDKIDFYPSNYSAVYGRGTGGMVDVGLRNPKGDGLHGMAQVDFIDARLMAEGPIFDSGWKFMVAARRSYFDAWLGPVLTSAGANVSTAPRYYDYQLMLQKDLSKRSSFRFTFFGSDDKLEILNQSPSASNPTFGGNLGAHTSFWRAHARYENRFTDATSLRLTGSVGRDSLDFGIGSNFYNTTRTPINARGELAQKLARGVQANVGFDLVYAPYDLVLRLPPQTRPGVPSGGPLDVAQESRRSDVRIQPAFYTEWEITPWRGGRVVPGVRADYSSGTKTWDIAPRINARQDLTSGFPRSTVKGGVGVFYQPPTILQNDPVFGSTDLKSNRAVHYDVGFEQEISRKVEITTDLFYKALDRLVVTGAGNSGEGFSYGAEWLLKYKADERFFGWVAYTLSRSERRDTPSEQERLFQYDQTHILTVLGSYKIGNGWQVGSRFRYVSGGLYTPNSQGALDATTGSNQAAPGYPLYGDRLPAFHQLDFRVDKTWTYPTWKLTFYADIQNVYFRENPEGVSYNYNYTQSAYTTGLPFLPSLGLRGEF